MSSAGPLAVGDLLPDTKLFDADGRTWHHPAGVVDGHHSRLRPTAPTRPTAASPTEDVHQPSADIVANGDGRITYLALPTSPDARPPVEELVRAARG